LTFSALQRVSKKRSLPDSTLEVRALVWPLLKVFLSRDSKREERLRDSLSCPPHPCTPKDDLDGDEGLGIPPR